MAKTRDERRSFFSSTGEPSGPLAEIRNGVKVPLEGWRTSDNGLQISTLRGQNTSDLSTIYPDFWRENERIPKSMIAPTVGAVPIRAEEREQYPGFFDTQGLVVGSQIGSAQRAAPTTPLGGQMELPVSRQYGGATTYSTPPPFKYISRNQARVAAPARAPKLGLMDWLKEPFWGLPKGAWVGFGSLSVVGVAIAAS